MNMTYRGIHLLLILVRLNCSLKTTMKLLTKALEKKLPAIHSATNKAYVKWFTPWTNWTWFVMEYDPETGTCFGFVEGLEKEFGYFNIKEIQDIKGPYGLKVERDLLFETTEVVVDEKINEELN